MTQTETRRPQGPQDPRKDATIPVEMRNQTLAPEFHTFPRTEVAISTCLKATVQGASAAAFHVEQFTGGNPEPAKLEESEKKRRVKILDKSSDAGFKDAWRDASVEVTMQDGEGIQEADPTKLGEAMPTAIGVHGSGEKKVVGVLDEVEATTKTSHGWNGGIAIVGITTYGGLTKLPADPDTGKPLQYLEKWFGPKEYRKVTDIRNPIRENITAIMKEGGIPAGNITIAMMERDCNSNGIQAARDMGVNVILTDSGDLEWGLTALGSDPEHPTFMAFRGGAPEGGIAMIAGRARDATAQIRVIRYGEKDLDIDRVKNGNVWNAEEFVPGAREHSIVVLSSITPNDKFDLHPVRRHDGAMEHPLILPPTDSPFDRTLHPGHHVVHSGIITAKGFQTRMHKVPIIEYHFPQT
ncbi:MAG: fructose-bisphosphatase class II [Candidatus Levyibacteriota bacterium]